MILNCSCFFSEECCSQGNTEVAVVTLLPHRTRKCSIGEVSLYLLQSKDIHVGLIGKSKLAVSDSLDGCVILCVALR